MGDNSGNSFLETDNAAHERVHNMNPGKLYQKQKTPALSEMVEPRGLDTGTLHVKPQKPEIIAPNLSLDKSHENVIVPPPKKNPFAIGFDALMNRLRFVSDVNEGTHWGAKPKPVTSDVVEVRPEWVDPRHAASADKLATIAIETTDAKIAAATTPDIIDKILDIGNTRERSIPGISRNATQTVAIIPDQNHINAGAKSIEDLIAANAALGGTEGSTTQKSTKTPPDAGVVERGIISHMSKPFSKQPDITAPRESQIGEVYTAAAGLMHQTVHIEQVDLTAPADEIDYEAHMGQNLPTRMKTGTAEIPTLTEEYRPESSDGVKRSPVIDDNPFNID